MGKMSDLDIELKDLGMITPTQTVLIPLEEYKELLIIKGKYEELKAYSMPHMVYKDATYMTLNDIEKELGNKVIISSVKGIKEDK